MWVQGRSSSEVSLVSFTSTGESLDGAGGLMGLAGPGVSDSLSDSGTNAGVFS